MEALWRLGLFEECRQLIEERLPSALQQYNTEQSSYICVDVAAAYAVMGEDAAAEAMIEKSFGYSPVGLFCTRHLEEYAVLKRLELYNQLMAQFA